MENLLGVSNVGGVMFERGEGRLGKFTKSYLGSENWKEGEL